MGGVTGGKCRSSGPRWCWKRSSCAIESPRWSAAELVAHASDHCVRAALILLSRWWSFCKATRGRGVRRSARRAVHRSAREIVSAESAVRYRWAFSRGSLLLTARLGRGDSNSKPSSHVRRHPDSEHQPGERREPERSEAGPNPGRTNSLQHGCSYSGRLVSQIRPESRLPKAEGPRQFKSPLSASQSSVFWILFLSG